MKIETNSWGDESEPAVEGASPVGGSYRRTVEETPPPVVPEEEDEEERALLQELAALVCERRKIDLRATLEAVRAQRVLPVAVSETPVTVVTTVALTMEVPAAGSRVGQAGETLPEKNK